MCKPIGGSGGYNRLSYEEKCFLQQVAHKIYASGKTGDIKAGSGYVGLLGNRLIDFSAGKFEAAFGRADSYKYDSSRALAQELAKIANKLGIRCHELSALARPGGKPLFERTVAVRVLTAIGGDELWKDGGFDDPARMYVYEALVKAENALAIRFDSFALPYAQAALKRLAGELEYDPRIDELGKKYSGEALREECRKLVESEIEQFSQGHDFVMAGATAQWLERVQRDMARGPRPSAERTATAEKPAASVSSALFPDGRVDLVIFREKVGPTFTGTNSAASARRRESLKPLLEHINGNCTARKDELRREAFKHVFGSLAGKEEFDEAKIRSQYPQAAAKFDREWAKYWDPQKVSAYAVINTVLEKRAEAQLDAVACTLDELLGDEGLKKALNDGMLSACGKDIGTWDVFVKCFDEVKAGFNPAAEVESIMKAEGFKDLVDTYTDEEVAAIRNEIVRVLDGFGQADTVENLSSDLWALRSAEDAKMFREILLALAKDAAVRFVAAHQVKNGRLERRVSSELVVEDPTKAKRTMKDILADAVGNKRGLRQCGGNNCFIKSVVNAMLGSNKGREILTGLIDENGSYHFQGYDPYSNQSAEIVITAAEIESARQSGVFPLASGGDYAQAYASMDDLELAVWLGLAQAHKGDEVFTERPGAIGEAGVVANLFGFKVVDRPVELDLGQWANAVNTLNHDGLALYRLAGVPTGGDAGGYRHFVAITGTDNKPEDKTKSYTVVDSATDIIELGMKLEYDTQNRHYANSVLCFEYVEDLK